MSPVFPDMKTILAKKGNEYANTSAEFYAGVFAFYGEKKNTELAKRARENGSQCLRPLFYWTIMKEIIDFL